MLLRLWIAAILVAIALTTPQFATGQSDTLAVVAPWVVVVFQPQPDGKHIALGTGFVAQGGYVVTAAHVIESDRAPVFLGTQGRLTMNRMRRAQVVRLNRDADIAILDGGYDPSSGLLHEQTVVEAGDEVSIFGYEFPGDAALLRLAQGTIGQKFSEFYQLSGPAQPGFSGGPVTTRGGRVVGIVDFGFKESPNLNLAYIVPDSTIRQELASLPARQQAAATSAPVAAPIPPLPQVRPAALSIQNTLIVPGQRLGVLTLGSTLTDVSKILGAPPDSQGGSPSYFTWTRYGITAFPDASGIVQSFMTANPAFSTSQGIRVGSTVEEVQQAYGLNYQSYPGQGVVAYIIHYPGGITFLIGSQTLHVAGIAVDRLNVVPASTLTGTYIGRYMATVQPGAIYEGVFQITQNGNTIVGSITTTSGRAGNIVGVVAGSRINATMTFTDACGGRASAIIDITNGGRTLVGNYTVTDCLGTYAGGFDLSRQ